MFIIVYSHTGEDISYVDASNSDSSDGGGHNAVLFVENHSTNSDGVEVDSFLAIHYAIQEQFECIEIFSSLMVQ